MKTPEDRIAGIMEIIAMFLFIIMADLTILTVVVVVEGMNR